MMRKLLIAGASVAALYAGSANAAVFAYTTDFSLGVGAEWSISAPPNSGAPGILGELGGGASSATLTQTSVGSGLGILFFDLLGFRTLDGTNSFADTLHVIINGVDVFQGTFGMGGGGGDAFTGPFGVSVAGSGGVRHIGFSFNAVTGANTFQFSEPSLQGFDDEAFGLDNVQFFAEVSDPVTLPPGIPEPATWALMIMGFGASGAMLRRRRAAFATI